MDKEVRDSGKRIGIWPKDEILLEVTWIVDTYLGNSVIILLMSCHEIDIKTYPAKECEVDYKSNKNMRYLLQ